MASFILASILMVTLMETSRADMVTTPFTTPPTTPPPIMNKFYSTYGASLHRQDQILDVKPFSVIKGVTSVQCLSLCLQRMKGKGKTCKSFNYGQEQCSLLSTYLCQAERNLTHAPGYSYFDLVSEFADETEFFKSKQCETIGRCSNKCRKFKLIKTPLSRAEAFAVCQKEQALLAMPRTLKDHDTLIEMMKKANILQSWIGITKRSGKFFYDDDRPLDEEFTLWGPGQPNDSGGTQQCVQMMSEMEYMWNDFDCARPVGFVCQYVW